MHQKLCTLLEKGYSVSFTPLKKGEVRLEVQEARQGTVNAVQVDLNPFEWRLSPAGIDDRLKEAIEALSLS